MYDNVAIDLNAYRHELSCHDLIILLLPARLYASQDGSCCVKPIVVLHLTVDGCTSHVDYTTIGSLAVWKKRDVICKHVTCNIYISAKS